MKDDHKDAIERFEAYADADRNNREDAVDDLKFAAGDQWDGAVRREREGSQRPVLTVNKLGQFVAQIAGDIRQSLPAIDPVPVDDDTDPVYAQIMAGLIRQIEYQSNATSAYNWGAEMAITCGIGHWQIVTEYADDTTFDQDIRIKRIIDPLSVIWDSSATELDRSDAGECFVSEMISEEQFKRQYKSKALPEDFPEASSNGPESRLTWYGDNKQVRIASHWRKVPVKKAIGLTADGKLLDLTGKETGEYAALGVVRTRVVDTHKIMHRKMSGSDWLDDEQEWAGKHIPIVPVIGSEISVDGRLIRHGIIRHAKDPQRLYNAFRTAAAELVMNQPKAPWLVPLHAIKGLENFWAKANTNIAYLPFHADPTMPNLRPERQMPPQGSSSMYQEVQVAEQDLYGTTGIYPSALGQKSNETSGRAIAARQREADTGTFIYQDNFKLAIKRTGDILIDLIPKIYDATRYVRILGPDGQESMTQINQVIQGPNGPEIINDISAAKFDVRVKVGSSFASDRERGREAMTQILQAQPQLFQIIGDKFIEALDFPGASELAARVKKTMPASLVGEGGAEPPPPDPALEQIKQAQISAAVHDAELKAGKVQEIQIKNMASAHQFGVESASEPEEYPAQ